MRVATILALTVCVGLAACQTTTTKDGVETGRTNAIVESEVARLIDELRYQHDNDLLTSLARLQSFGDAAIAQIRRGAKSDDWLTRSSIAWLMGAASDRRYIPDLHALASDSVTSVRYQAAASLVELGDGAGFSVLVEGLSDADIRARYKCFQELKRATSQDFGYQHDAAPEVRRVAVARWLDWLDGLRASAL